MRVGTASKPPLSRDFGHLLLSRACANLSDGIALGMLPLLVAEVTRSPFLIALSAVGIYLPWLFIGPLAGSFVDRRSRPAVMLASDALRAALYATLGFAVLMEPRNALLVVPVVGVAVGSLEVLSDTAAGAHVPVVVRSEHLERANARLAGTELLMNALIGPSAGAGLFLLAPSAAVLTQASLMSLSAALILRLRGAPPPVRTTQVGSIRAELLDGLRFIVGSPSLRRLIPATALQNLAFGASAGVLILHLAENTDFGEESYGAIWTVAAVGGLGGAYAATRVIDVIDGHRTLLLSAAIMSATLLVVGLTSLGVVIAIAYAARAVGEELWNVVAVSYRQRVTPNEMLGRVGATARTIIASGLPIGGLLAGTVAEIVSLRQTILLAATIGVIAILLILSNSSFRIDEAEFSS